MSVFVDTSALYAYLDRDDANNPAAVRVLRGLLGAEALVTHAYVVVECASLMQRRLGATGARVLLEDIMPLVGVRSVGESVHAAATSAFLASVHRRTSLVDWVSFEIMRREGIRRAFAFDRGFSQQGFELVA